MNELDLLDRWTAGDRLAGEELFRRYLDALVRFFRNRVRFGVEDLVQRTLLGCIEGRTRFRGEASFRTFVFRIARNQLCAHHRERNRMPPADVDLTEVAALEISQADLFARRQEEHLLLRGLQRLPEGYQILFELSLWEGLPGPQIARMLGVPEGTLRSRLRLATRRLRKEIGTLSSAKILLPEPEGDLEAWAQRVREAFSLHCSVQ